MSEVRVVLKRRPKQYPRTPQQQKFLDAVEFCGIKKGISKKKLQVQMKECIPKFYKTKQIGDQKE